MHLLAHRGRGARVAGQGDHGLRHVEGAVDRRRRAQLPPHIVAAVAQAGRIDEGGEDVADMNAGPARQLAPQSLGEAAKPELAGAVGGRIGRRHPGAEGVGVDQHAPPPRLEMRQDGMGAVHVAEQVGPHHLVMRIRRDLGEAAHRADPGIVDPDIDMAELAHRRLRQPPHRAGIGHVGRHGDGAGAMRAGQPAALRHRLVQHAFPPGGEDKIGPLRGEGLGRRAADAAGCPSDHHHRPLQVAHDPVSSCRFPVALWQSLWPV